MTRLPRKQATNKRSTPKPASSPEVAPVEAVAPDARLTIGETGPAPVEAAPVVAPVATVPVIAELPIASIRTDGGTQSRASLSTATIAEYAEAMTAGAMFPPVVVFYDGKTRWLADGFHRVNAHLKVDHTHIACEVRKGSQRDAILYSVAANAAHGLRRTTADKRHAISLLLSDAKFSRKSDRAIGELCGVDHKTVTKRREEISGGEIPQLPTTREGRDGKQQPASKPTPKTKPTELASVTPALPAALPVASLAEAALAEDLERHMFGWTLGHERFVATLKASSQRAREHFSQGGGESLTKPAANALHTRQT
jgi:hypothetical protein